MLSSYVSVYGQKIITGRVIDEDLEAMPFVRVLVSDTLFLGETNLEGYFEVSVPKGTDDISFGSVGYEMAPVSIPDSCADLEVILLYNVLYHYISNRKVDRLRKRRFDKMPELHRTAMENGLFSKEAPCYQREFVPYKPQLDEIGRYLKKESKAVKEYFKELEIGDTIKVPYSGSYRADGTDRTSLSVFSYAVDDGNFDCIIEGVVVKKNRRNGGFNLVYEVVNTRLCKYDSIVYHEKEIRVGDVLTHNMKYFKVIGVRQR